MAEATDMILPLLREMRAESIRLHSETRGVLDTVEKPLAAQEKAQKTFRHARAANSLLGKLVTGAFGGRIEALERKFAAWEAMK